MFKKYRIHTALELYHFSLVQDWSARIPASQKQQSSCLDLKMQNYFCFWKQPLAGHLSMGNSQFSPLKSWILVRFFFNASCNVLSLLTQAVMYTKNHHDLGHLRHEFCANNSWALADVNKNGLQHNGWLYKKLPKKTTLIGAGKSAFLIRMKLKTCGLLVLERK